MMICLIFILQIYSYILKKNAPFKNDYFNKLEYAGNQIISGSFILAMGSYSKELGDTLDIIFYIIFLAVNWVFIAFVILLIMELIIFKVMNNAKGSGSMLKCL